MWKISFQIRWNFIWTHLCPTCWVLITPYPMFCNFIQSFVCTKYLLRTEREDFLNYFPGSFIIYEEEDEEVEKKASRKSNFNSTSRHQLPNKTHPLSPPIEKRSKKSNYLYCWKLLFSKLSVCCPPTRSSQDSRHSFQWLWWLIFFLKGYNLFSPFFLFLRTLQRLTTTKK